MIVMNSMLQENNGNVYSQLNKLELSSKHGKVASQIYDISQTVGIFDEGRAFHWS